MDGFTTQNVDPTDPTGSRTMGYYDQRTLPFYYGIANEFSVADRYFASVPGPTFPNRFYLLTGTSFGYTSNVTQIYTQKTIFQSLDEAPTPVSWKIYLASVPGRAVVQVRAGPRRWSRVPDRRSTSPTPRTGTCRRCRSSNRIRSVTSTTNPTSTRPRTCRSDRSSRTTSSAPS